MEGADYFEHDADIGVIGRGASVGQAFERAAAAMFAVMTDLAAVQRSVQVAFDFEEADLQIYPTTEAGEVRCSRSSGMQGWASLLAPSALNHSGKASFSA